MFLVFNLQKIPRSLTKKEWKEIWRWKRITEKELKIEVEKRMVLLSVYGSTMPEHIKDDLLYSLSNPPLLLGPYQ